MSDALMEECGVKVGPGLDYPPPIVDPNVQPKIMISIGRGQERGCKQGKGKHNQKSNNPNRGRGQRQDMKSLKTGNYQFEQNLK